MFASNTADALREASWLAGSWRFASGNFALVASSLGVFSLSRGWAGAAFLPVLVLELAAAALFWRAAWEPHPLGPSARTRVARPFLAGIALFCGFLVFDEALLIYRRVPSLETTHFVILCALLLSLLAIHAIHEPGPVT